MSFQGSELISIFTPSKGIFHTFTKTFRNKRYIVDHLSRLDLLLLWRWGKGLGEASGAAVSGAYHGGSGENSEGYRGPFFRFSTKGAFLAIRWWYVDEAVQPILTRNHSSSLGLGTLLRSWQALQILGGAPSASILVFGLKPRIWVWIGNENCWKHPCEPSSFELPQQSSSSQLVSDWLQACCCGCSTTCIDQCKVISTMAQMHNPIETIRKYRTTVSISRRT